MELRNFSYFLTSIIVLLGLFTPSPLIAQQTFLSLGSEVALIMSPEFPEPNQEVTFTAQSFIVDVDARRIIWKVDGKEMASGIGLTSFTTMSKDTGVQTVVEATVILPSETVVKRRVISPGGMDILWESPLGEKPPFYKGKVLPVREGTLNVVAIPRIPSFTSPSATKDYVFTWEQDFRIKGSDSGFGRNSYRILSRISDRSADVGVGARNPAGDFESFQRITIPFFEPEILVYQEDSELGTLIKPISDSLSLQGSETTLIAEPFYFTDPDPLARNLIFNWRIGNSDLRGPNGTVLHKRAPIQATGSGNAFINIKVENPSTLYQEATEGVQLIFR